MLAGISGKYKHEEFAGIAGGQRRRHRCKSHLTRVVCPPQMMLYLSFPVAMFWVSNQAEYFEEYIVKRKVSVCNSSDLL